MERGEYSMMFNHSKQIIRAEEWCRKIKLGMELDKKIIFRQTGQILKDKRRKCPGSYYKNSKVTAIEGWVDW